MNLNLIGTWKQWLSDLSTSAGIKILWPFSTVWGSFGIWILSISAHTSVQVLLLGPTIASLSMSNPMITSTSYNVIVISPCGRWNVWVSRRHCSTNAVINAWSSCMDGTECRPSRPSNLTMTRTRSSTIGTRSVNSSWQLRQSSVLGGSYKYYNNRYNLMQIFSIYG